MPRCYRATLAALGALGFACSALVDFDECSADDDCPGAQRCDTANGACYLAPGGDAGADRAFGAACARDADCADGVCRQEDGRCSRACDDLVACATEDFGPDVVACEDSICAFRIPPPLALPAVVGILVAGPVADVGLAKTVDAGRRFVERHYADRALAVTTRAERAETAADAPAAIERLVAAGADVVVGTSPEHVPALESAAAARPGVRFLSGGGFAAAGVEARNLGSFSGRMYQAVYLAGQVAGRATRALRVGVVGTVPRPEAVRNLDAFAVGVRQAAPDAEVQVLWTLAPADPQAETAAAQTLMDAGADVLWSMGDPALALGVAGTRQAPDGGPVLGIGDADPDACAVAPDICLTTPYWNWGPLLVRQIQALLEGTWDHRTLVWEPIRAERADSAVALAPVSEALLPGAESAVAALTARLASGEVDPFDGPLSDNGGGARVVAGQRLSDGNALQMCWYVEGIFEPGDAHRPAAVPTGCDGIR